MPFTTVIVTWMFVTNCNLDVRHEAPEDDIMGGKRSESEDPAEVEKQLLQEDAAIAMKGGVRRGSRLPT